MRSCSAACPVDSSHAQLLTGDAMSLHPKIENRKEKIENKNGIGEWHLVSFLYLLSSIFYLLFSISAHAGEPRRSSVAEAVERARGAAVNIHSERTVLGPASEALFSLSPSQD